MITILKNCCNKVKIDFLSDLQCEETKGVADSQCLSAGVAAGIAVMVTILAILPLGILIGCCGLWYIALGRRGTKSGGGSGSGSGTDKQQEAVIYEEPEPGPVAAALALRGNMAYEQVGGQRTTEMPLSDNVAYGHVQGQRN